jgi:hypothetical protein
VSEQTIQSQDAKVADIFGAFYVVPDYQREYVWETDEVEQLLSDINGELAGTDSANAPEYFIGSIVVCPGQGGTLELIDGQQRMTTLFVALCAIRDRIQELKEAPPGALPSQIAATSTDASGQDQFRYRVDLQYEDSADVLVRIAKGERGDVPAPSTRSVANIVNAYHVCIAFLKREFGDDAAAIRSYYGYLANKVKLIKIETEDVAKALKIFETINDRGKSLDSMDLLKNLLFMKASREQFDKLKNVWKEMQDTIFHIGEKPLRFLRYFILSRYNIGRDVLREDEIYGWFSKNEAQCQYAKDPVGFASELLAAAKAYRHFVQGQNEQGEKNRYLENLVLLGGKAARQHLILLLAGRDLPSPLFDKLSSEVENLFLVYVITREPTRNFERNFAAWANELRQIRDGESLDDLIKRRFDPAKAALSGRFDDAFQRLYDDSVQFYRLKYVLAKLTQYVQIDAYGENEGTKWLSIYTGGGYEVEHIFPQNPSAAALSEFGVVTDPRVAGRVGNLLLVEKAINASLGNRPFSAKLTVYPESKLLLTHAVAKKPSIGAKTQIDRAVAHLEPYATWNEGTIASRQDLLASLARKVWNVPASGRG